jgi:hypothetical protein
LPAIKPDEDTRLRLVEERLAVSFADSKSPQEVHDSVQRAYETFDGAHVRTYIPLLVARMAAGELRAAGRPHAIA